MSRFLDDALGRKPDAKPPEASNGYKALHTSKNNRPQMGFSLVHASGDMDGFMYHTVSHLRFETTGAREFVSFTHSGLAVSIEGTGLKDLFNHIMRHTLQEAHEYDGQRVEPSQPVITRIAVTDTRATRIEPAARLVK